MSNRRQSPNGRDRDAAYTSLTANTTANPTANATASAISPKKLSVVGLLSDMATRRGVMYVLAAVGLLALALQRPAQQLLLGPSSSLSAATGTSSFALLQSLQCTHPKQSDRPKIQYALIIDAGSTGSRIHVYRFNYCHGPQPTLEDEVFEQLKPGLSSFNDPLSAAASLDPLLQTALHNVPVSLHACTPVTVKATAGLRMLGGDLSSQILAAIASKLAKDYPFPVLSHDGVVVMEGSSEGIYAWITVNYLLGYIGAPDRRPTAAILDLGGGSTQIVFEPDLSADSASGGHLIKGPHRSDLSFGGVVYSLYQHSYDGYGLRAGRSKLLGISADGSPEDGKTALLQPCVRKGREVEIIASDHIGEIVGTADGFSSCKRFITTHLFDQSASRCKLSPPLRTCSFDGIYMPTLTTTFAENEMYAFSYFFDNYAEPFGATKGFRVGDIREAAEMVCKGDTSHLTALGKQFYQENPHWCMDLGFMHQLLATGYGLPDSRPMKTAKKINGIETGWALGAAIQILDSLITPNGKNGACRAN
ncbi:hypothetical protein BASA50_003755 [Batrachochytrium salamandrivorans]|uniref:guanosine-diphosphatase n=1 Tax=Batrachochytrium salamandrivorans TaxID=1357716 RepID=A0ABQ8FL80_9FUNG|nr:hypothetical protein BASA62_005963 [Batrachochytrium salamandrivorans]KAH6598720.1 hypothetical protein BASA50_003755 [Batrachochytrium salamandrivorans]KAH6602468.1 hypothetical protein BASA61_001075 [Batrachochytrium salamandrivorans]KAH9264173.1 hypothetical protein BASA83_012371 [Batrachochytrium salamandrivorans]